MNGNAREKLWSVQITLLLADRIGWTRPRCIYTFPRLQNRVTGRSSWLLPLCRSSTGHRTRISRRWSFQSEANMRKASVKFCGLGVLARATAFAGRKAGKGENATHGGMGSEGTRSWGLVFTHELHPDTRDEGGKHRSRG